MKQNKERNFRFPVFSDNTGVKLAPELPDTFLEDAILTQIRNGLPKEGVQKSPEETKIEAAVDVAFEPKIKSHPSASTSHLKSSTYEKNMYNQETYTVEKRAFSTRTERKNPFKSSHFVPKYIPASLISDEVKPEISPKEVRESLFKRPESYTLLDDGSFQEAPEETKQIIPKSLVENKGEKKVVENKETPKKRSALDKSLKGIFQEEQTPFFNRYFEE